MNQGIPDPENFLNSLPVQVKCVAVSKTKPVEEIMRLYDLGHRFFGENKVQEMVLKYERLPKDIEWHLVGHLQTNKVKSIAGFISLIHSVDSLHLLETINREALKAERIIDVLLQMYIATEETKYGMDRNELNTLLESESCQSMRNIRIRGLMGIASFTADVVQVRNEFRTLKNTFEEIKSDYFKGDDHFSELSMGMSGDYTIAIEEGATIIRIGSILFGERNYI